MLVEMQSLGWRKGFEVTGEYSALGDEDLMGRVSERLKQLLQVVDGDYGSLDAADRNVLEDQVEELEDENQALKTELNQARRRIEELEKVNEESASLDELLTQINAVLGDTYDCLLYTSPSPRD